MRYILLIILFLSFITSNAQTPNRQPYYIFWGNMALGKGTDALPDPSAILDLGKDTGTKGVLMPKVLLNNVVTTKRGLFVYSLADSALFHFDGTSKVRYMTYKDTVLIKQLISAYAPQVDLSGILDSLADLYDTAAAHMLSISGKEPSISPGTTAQYWRGDKSWQTLNKSAVGLSNVDNTADVNKPVSNPAKDSFSVHWTQIYANYQALQLRLLLSDSTTKWASIKRLSDTSAALRLVAANGWNKAGNSFGSIPILGTMDNNPFDIYSFGAQRGRVHANGRFTWKTVIDAGFDFDINGTGRFSGTFTVSATPGIYITSGTSSADVILGIPITSPAAANRRVIIGHNSSWNTSKFAQVLVGWGNNVQGDEQIAIGEFNTIASGVDAGNVVLGNNNTVNYSGSGTSRSHPAAFGGNNQVLHQYSTAVGCGNITTGSRQYHLGNYQSNADASYRDYYLGIQRAGGDSRGIAYTPGTVNIHGAGAGYGNVLEGSDIRLVSGLSTDSARRTKIILSTYSKSNTANGTAQTRADRWFVYGDYGTFTNSSSYTGTALTYMQSTTQFTKPVPHMTQAQRDAITAEAWVMVICTDCLATDGSTGVVQVYNGSTWKNLY